MLSRFATLFVLSALLTGTSQAFTITLTGMMDLSVPVGPPPAMFAGDGTYAFTAVLESDPGIPSSNPGTLTFASLDLTSAGFASVFTYSNAMVTVNDNPGGPDSASFLLPGGPGISAVTFNFTNGNVLSNSLANNDNMAALIKGQSTPPLGISASGFLFALPGPGSITVGPITNASAIVATPEPSSWALLALLSVGGGVVYRRRKQTRTTA